MTGIVRRTMIVFLLAPALLPLPSYGRGFLPATHYAINANQITSGDFNGDGNADIMLASGGSLYFLAGNGDGTFQDGKITRLPLGYYIRSVVAGDFNNDSRLDLSVGDDSFVSILLGNGDGTFQFAHNYHMDVLAETAFQVVGDFNHDGNTDLVPSSCFGNLVKMLIGTGDGTFTGTKYYGWNCPQSIVAGDFNNDGNLDVAVTNTVPNAVTVLLGNGDGTLQERISSDANSAVYQAAGDFNGDGRLDLAAGGGKGTAILLGDGTGHFRRGSYVVFDYGYTLAADFDKDGNMDLVGMSEVSSIHLMFGRGDGTFEDGGTYAGGVFPGWNTIADFNNDGFPDYAEVSAGGDGLYVFLNTGP